MVLQEQSLGDTMSSPEECTEMPRLPSHVTFHTIYYILLFPLQFTVCQTEPMTDFNFSPNQAHHRKLVGFALHLPYCIRDLTLSMD